MSERPPTSELDTQLTSLLQAGVLSGLDVELAHLLRRLDTESSPWVALTAALVSRATQAGHVCLALDSAASLQVVDAEERPITLRLPQVDSWLSDLRDSPLVSDGSRLTPLVLQDRQVYLHRYFSYEQRLLAAIHRKLHANDVPLAPSAATALQQLFCDAESGDLQRRAALLACTHRLCVISGGPGTGKTTTVAKVLVAVSQQLHEQGQDVRLSLLAPTGKAAARLAESLAHGLAPLSLSETQLAALKVTPSTIHRALGYQPRSPTHFRHNAANPLPSNVVVVDEASMVDLALMTKLVEAVPTDAHLILLGDRDQLASVEAGAVFGDLFDTQTPRRYGAASAKLTLEVFGETLSPIVPDFTLPPIAECTIHLERSYRYAERGGIASLARAIREGNVAQALDAVTREGVSWLELSEADSANGDCSALLSPLLAAGFEGFCRAASPAQRLTQLAQFRVLSPHRKGRLGISGLNQLCEEALVQNGLRPRAGAYAGQPILITQNDYQANLYNGDIGIIETNATGKLAAFFPEGDGVRHISLARLPAYSTVYAMTIHKSQGSEFERVLVVLPHHASPLLSRELLYTAVTRAKQHVTLVCSRESLSVAVERRIERASGLRNGLWSAAHGRGGTSGEADGVGPVKV